MTPVLAFDPGGRKSGVVLRDRDELIGWQLVVRTGDGRMPRDGHYLRAVLEAGLDLLRKAGIPPPLRDRYVVGVEEVAYWPEAKGSKVRRDQRGLYGTAMVYGAILTRWPDAVVVDSGRGVGKLHPSVYPLPIRGKQGGKGTDRLVDVRAAWDHSYAAETVHLQTIREARP